MNETSRESEPKQPGVFGDYFDDEGYRVFEVRWADGQEGKMHVPEKGFQVVDPITRKNLYFLLTQRAKRILQEQAPRITRGEFSWEKFPPSEKKK